MGQFFMYILYSACLIVVMNKVHFKFENRYDFTTYSAIDVNYMSVVVMYIQLPQNACYIFIHSVLILIFVFSIVFQTLFVEPTMCLCDCPGLTMPSFVSTKAEMVVNGILPIDQIRDFIPPISLISF